MIAVFLRLAMTCGAVAVRTVERSSSKVTSRTQCTAFSIPVRKVLTRRVLDVKKELALGSVLDTCFRHRLGCSATAGLTSVRGGGRQRQRTGAATAPCSAVLLAGWWGRECQTRWLACVGMKAGVAGEWSTTVLPRPVTSSGMAEPALAVGQLVARAASPGFDGWWLKVSGCGFCARPVHLVGTDGAGREHAVLARCKNRRASVCPSCSDLYAADTW